MNRSVLVRAWWVGATACIALVAAIALPASAAASSTSQTCIDTQQGAPVQCNDTPSSKEPRLAPAGHIGWAYLNLNHCPAQMVCAAVYRENTLAYRYNGKGGWSQTRISQGWVYAYPFSGDWRWLWTAQTGWVAVHGARLELR